MSADSVIQLWEGRHHSFTDWHPPIMGWLFGKLDYLYTGPALMLILHNLVFWLGLGICAIDTLGHRRKTWLLIVLLGFAPPITSHLGIIWKDIGLGAFFVLAFALTHRASLLVNNFPREARIYIFLALPLLFYAVAVRHNAPPALLPLFVWLGWIFFKSLNVQFSARRRFTYAFVAGSVLLGGFITLTGVISRSLTHGKSAYVVQALLLHDLVAISIETEQFLIPPSLLNERSPRTIAALKKLYDPASMNCLYYCFTDITFDESQNPEAIADLKKAWRRGILAHPYAYLLHRWRVYQALLGTTWDPPERPFRGVYGWGEYTTDGTGARNVDLKYTPNRVSFLVYYWTDLFVTTPLFKEWLYLLLPTVLLIYAFKQGVHQNVPLVVLALSALLYMLPYFFISVSAEFRYVWLAVCACALAPLFIFQQLDNSPAGLSHRGWFWKGLPYAALLAFGVFCAYNVQRLHEEKMASASNAASNYQVDFDFCAHAEEAEVMMENPQAERPSPGTVTIGNGTRPAITMAPKTTMTFRNVSVGAGNPLLQFAVGIPPEEWEKAGDGLIFKVTIEANGQAYNLFSKYLNPKKNPADRRWDEQVVDLSAFYGQKVDVVLAMDYGPEGQASVGCWGTLELIDLSPPPAPEAATPQ